MTYMDVGNTEVTPPNSPTRHKKANAPLSNVGFVEEGVPSVMPGSRVITPPASHTGCASALAPSSYGSETLKPCPMSCGRSQGSVARCGASLLLGPLSCSQSRLSKSSAGERTISISYAILRSMDNQIALEVEFVDRSWNGVLVIFSDGQTAIYPPELLLRLLPQASPVGTTNEP